MKLLDQALEVEADVGTMPTAKEALEAAIAELDKSLIRTQRH